MAFRLTQSAFVAVLYLAAPVTHAAAVFSQTPTVNEGFLSDPSAFSVFYQADDFNLTSADTVTFVTWRGIYSADNSPLATDDFTINFYSDAAGLPGSLLQSFSVGNPDSRVDTLLNAAGSDVYEYVADLGTGIALSASTSYWVSIFNDTNADTNDNWFWGLADPGIGNSARSTDLSSWQALATNEFYFILSDANPVPVPAAAWLFGSALGLLGWLRRRS